MTLDRLLDPGSIAIVGLSDDPAKHGGRVLQNLRKLGYAGKLWGVNPRLPDVDGADVFASVSALPQPPDLLVCAVPAAAAVEVVGEAAGAGAAIVFAGGFGETGATGKELEGTLARSAAASGVRLLGPNSGGVIRPARSLAASFLTCLDRPAAEIKGGSVGLVTQSGGTGSYIHNLAAARGGGLAISVSTGNETDIELGEGMSAVAQMDDVGSVLILIETIRDGEMFRNALRQAADRGKPVVACRIGTGTRGRRLMTTHTGAMAIPGRVLGGVLTSFGVTVAETPQEAYEVAEILARVPQAAGSRVGMVTHSGGTAIHLADLSDRAGLDLPLPSDDLEETLAPLLDQGTPANPLDMGGIIGGPTRFANVVDTFASSGEFDVVLAVSTAHPPAHSKQRVDTLLALHSPVPIVHLWMAGDQARLPLERLRASDAPVTEEPRAAIRALAGLTAPSVDSTAPALLDAPFEVWGLPLITNKVVTNIEDGIAFAEEIGYPVVLKMASSGLTHKTESGGIRLDLRTPEQLRSAFSDLVGAATERNLSLEGIRIEPYRPGLEMIVGGVSDPVFGPMISVGIGGIHTELVGDVVFAPAPLSSDSAVAMIRRLRGFRILEGFRGAPPADIDELARLVSVVSRGIAGSGITEVELNPLIWSDDEWVAVDWLLVGDDS